MVPLDDVVHRRLQLGAGLAFSVVVVTRGNLCAEAAAPEQKHQGDRRFIEKRMH